TIPLSELGDLPRGLDDMYDNWETTAAWRLVRIPYLIAPLAVAFNESNFQHFFSAPIINEDKKCSAITTAQPIGPIQTKIDAAKSKLQTLETNVANASAEVQQSDYRIVQIDTQIKAMFDEHSVLSQCFGQINERVMRGAS